MKSYYPVSSIFVSENFDYPGQAITYDGIISLKTGFSNTQNEVSKLSSSLGESSENIYQNSEMERALEENASSGSDYDSFDKSILIASVFMIFNVFNIMLKSMIKEIGMIRVIGMSKKKSLTFFLIKIAFIWLVGSILGLIGGYFLSSVMIKNFIYTVGILDPRVAPVYLSFTIIKKTLITTTITVLISTIIPIVVTIKSSPIELLNGSYKTFAGLIKERKNKRNKKSIKNKKHFKFKKLINKTQENIFKNSLSATMAINNSKRNFIYILSTGIIVGMAGVSIVSLFSDQKSTLYKDNPLILQLNGYDIDLTYKGESSSKNNGISKECLDEISKIDGVTDIYTYKKEFGYLNLKDSELSEGYRKASYIKSSEKTRDNMVEVVSIPQKDMKQNISKNKNLLEDGRLFNKDSDVLEAVAFNKFYDLDSTHDYQKYSNNLRVGDVVDLKVSIENNNKLEYKSIKVKIVGLLDANWGSITSTSGAMPDIVIDTEDYYKFTGSSNFEQVKIKVDPNTSQQVKNEVKDKINYDTNIKYDDKDTLYKEFAKYRYQAVNQRLMEAILLGFAAFMNIIFSIITSIEVRSREFEVMRCVGLSIKDLKKILLKEGLIYGIVSSLIGFVFIFNYGVKLSYMLRMGAKYKNIPYTGSWYVIPIIPTLIFILITIVACLLSVACTFKALDKPIIAEKNKNS
ncbi:FtsX-like permease family protein [Romboutsia sedimentorum]|uniref:FtsX-like permease family protein n=1 Tax=Romboutsia sedimentorum TaxID=1368474 RepID=A0ABT7EA14_9FIRM|nr:FtsX-like permease family protein [Romboutsia sedimentorum]MDK2562913.1 FtsX-like permease family protein [Romboutsia sedimentorum]